MCCNNQLRTDHRHHHHLSLNRESRWGTSYDFTTRFPHFSLFLAALWELGELLACPFPEVVFVFSLPAKWTNLHKIRYIHRLENAKDKFNDCFENAPLSLHRSNKTESVLWPLTFDCAKRWQMPELACHISLPRNWRTAKEMLARGKRDKKKQEAAVSCEDSCDTWWYFEHRFRRWSLTKAVSEFAVKLRGHFSTIFLMSGSCFEPMCLLENIYFEKATSLKSFGQPWTQNYAVGREGKKNKTDQRTKKTF